MRRKAIPKLAACLVVLVLTVALFTNCGKGGTGVTDPGTRNSDNQAVTEEEKKHCHGSIRGKRSGAWR